MITLLNHRRAIREFLNTYTEALLPHVVPRIFEIAVLSLKKDFGKINFELEELDEIIYELREKDFIERQANKNLKKIAREKMEGKICIAKHNNGLCNGACLQPLEMQNGSEYDGYKTMQDHDINTYNSIQKYFREDPQKYTMANNTAFYDKYPIQPEMGHGLGLTDDEDNYRQHSDFYGKGYYVPKSRRLRNNVYYGGEETLKNPHFTTQNKRIYPKWWWNEKPEDYSDYDSEREHHPGNKYDIAAKEITNRKKHIMSKRRYNDDDVFNYSMNPLEKADMSESMQLPQTLKSNGQFPGGVYQGGQMMPQNIQGPMVQPQAMQSGLATSSAQISAANPEQTTKPTASGSEGKKGGYSISFDKNMKVKEMTKGNLASDDFVENPEKQVKTIIQGEKVIHVADGIVRNPSKNYSRRASRANTPTYNRAHTSSKFS